MSPARSRRRSRSVRLVVAVVLVSASAAVGLGALLLATVPALTTATVIGVSAGIAAISLASAEVAAVRRQWARDRADVADGYRVDAQQRRDVQAVFVQQVTDTIATRDAEINRQRIELNRLRDRLVDTEIEVARATERLAAERSRVASLESDVDAAASDLASARSDLIRAQDALAISEAAGVAARAEIDAWEQAAGVSDPQALGSIPRSA